VTPRNELLRCRDMLEGYARAFRDVAASLPPHDTRGAACTDIAFYLEATRTLVDVLGDLGGVDLPVRARGDVAADADVRAARSRSPPCTYSAKRATTRLAPARTHPNEPSSTHTLRAWHVANTT
jgi:hypothetical protein